MNIAPILKAGFIVVALAGLLVSALLASQASANDFRWGTACGHGHRISKGSSDWQANCLSARWSNSWNFSRAGYEVNVKNECSEYGTIVTNIDIKSADDAYYHLHSSNEERFISIGKIRDVTCCINGSDLCFKRQIEGEWIKHVTVTGSGWSQNWVDVRTQKRRYNFCQDNPDDIYCEVDPEGDAHVTPPPLNCGDHYCTVDDCESQYAQSSAVETCSGLPQAWNMTISSEEGESQTCTVTEKCMSHIVWFEDRNGGYWVYEDTTLSAEVEDMDDLHNCSGVLQIGAC